MMKYRPTLDAPPAPRDEVVEGFFERGREGEYLHLGRGLKVKKRERRFRGLVWMYVPVGGESNGGVVVENQSEHDSKSDEPTTSRPPKPRIILNDDGNPSLLHPSPHHTLTSYLPFTHRSTTAPPPAYKPLSLQTLVPLLDLLGLSSPDHIKTLQDFLHTKLPP
ncbi:hypothetical protein HK097_004806, partial [Rhizophlyctis rosea]